jgi:2-polyprenyl-3-methyl-5-hydroxy-6-metoxy-1,4-benzoquinol methylase
VKKERVLDIGCWSGKRVEELLAKGIDAWGMDVTDEHFKEAPEKVRNRLFVWNITEAFEEQFDFIYLTEVLEHLEDDEIALMNVHYLLKPGGTVYITTPKSIPFLEFWDSAWIKWKLGGARHYHYTDKEIQEKLNKAGFKVCKRATGDIKWLLFKWINTILKNGFRLKKQYVCEKGIKGYFDWEIMAKK